jgi:hypothetical protein
LFPEKIGLLGIPFERRVDEEEGIMKVGRPLGACMGREISWT